MGEKNHLKNPDLKIGSQETRYHARLQGHNKKKGNFPVINGKGERKKGVSVIIFWWEAHSFVLKKTI